MEHGYSSSGRPMHPGPGQPNVIPPGYPPHGGMPPNQPGYGMPQQQQPPVQQQQQPVVNQAQPQVINVVNQEFRTSPVSITCQFCKNPVTTVVEKHCNCCACCLCWMTGLVFFVCIQCCRGKEIGCCDATHKCPTCGQILGTYVAC